MTGIQAEKTLAGISRWSILRKGTMENRAPTDERLERTRPERASLLSCVSKPLKRSVMLLELLLDQISYEHLC
jgi:hypothetical protein